MRESMSSRRALSREQALRWRSWADRDLSYILEQIERLEVTSFEEAPDGSYIHARRGGRTVMYVNPGFLEFAKGCEPADAQRTANGGAFRPLSTHAQLGGRTRGPLQGNKVCPVHPELGLLPVSGECDECG